MTPVFTVVIPVFQVEEYIDRCVRSVLAQTFRDIEIILVDDGSPDNCPAICDSYGAQDARVKVLHKENGGLSDARNAGIAAATGEYILLLDSDDYINLDTCEKLLPWVEHGCDIITGDGICEGGTTPLAHSFECPICDGETFLKEAIMHGCMPMAAWLNVYKRSFLEQNRLSFKKGILHEDEQFTPRAFLAAKRVANSQLCFYHYVIRDGSITTGMDMRKNARDFYETSQELLPIYQQLEDPRLKTLLIDSLTVKYLSLFQTGRLYRNGKEYCPKAFLWRQAKLPKTRAKAALFCLSPRLYWHINAFSKHISCKK